MKICCVVSLVALFCSVALAQVDMPERRYTADEMRAISAAAIAQIHREKDELAANPKKKYEVHIKDLAESNLPAVAIATAPDGEFMVIKLSRSEEAKAEGFTVAEPGVYMILPDGTPGVVPQSQVAAAQKERARLLNLTILDSQVVQKLRAATVPGTGSVNTNCTGYASGNAYGNSTTITAHCTSYVQPDFTAYGVARAGYLYGILNGQHIVLYAKPNQGLNILRGAMQGGAAGAGGNGFGDGYQRGQAVTYANGDLVGKMLPNGYYSADSDGSNVTVYYRKKNGKEAKAKYTIMGTW